MTGLAEFITDTSTFTLDSAPINSVQGCYQLLMTGLAEFVMDNQHCLKQHARCMTMAHICPGPCPYLIDTSVRVMKA